MIDVAKHIEYWRVSAEEDWNVALNLVKDGKTRHGLFFAHLALEKVLKAHVCRNTKDLAPKLHNLVRLAELAGIEMSVEQKDLLADMNSFQIECRYPELLKPQPSIEDTKAIITRTEGVYKWLMNRL